eukprot:525839-Pelagomonas_calceolata.AAC.3
MAVHTYGMYQKVVVAPMLSSKRGSRHVPRVLSVIKSTAVQGAWKQMRISEVLLVIKGSHGPRSMEADKHFKYCLA